jgi:hypothetical protein
MGISGLCTKDGSVVKGERGPRKAGMGMDRINIIDAAKLSRGVNRPLGTTL